MTKHGFVMIAALALSGCAHDRTDQASLDENVVRLPSGERQRIVDMHRGVDVAQENLNAARVAKSEAMQFRSVADQEQRAAAAQVQAARAGVELGRRSQSAATLGAAEDQLSVSEARLEAAKLKRDYADRLARLRQAQLDERQAQLDLANAEVRFAKADKVLSAGMGVAADEERADRQRRQARQTLADRRRSVAELNGQVARARTQWEQRRRDLAMRSDEATPIRPPAAPEALPSWAPLAAPTDVNEGPAAPESVPDSNFAR